VGLEELHQSLTGMEQRITSAIHLRLFDDAALLHAERSCASVQAAAAACPIPPPLFAAAPPAPVPVAAAIVAATAHSISSSVLLGCVADSNRVQQFISLLSPRLFSRSYRLLYAWNRRKSSGSAASFHEHCDGQARAVFCFRRSSSDIRIHACALRRRRLIADIKQTVYSVLTLPSLTGLHPRAHSIRERSHLWCLRQRELEQRGNVRTC
jgi:hypothetical protein